MLDEKLIERVQRMTNEYQRLLEINFPKAPEDARDGMALAKIIRDELESMGFLVTWEATITCDDPPTVDVNVTVWRVKDNLTPEEQNIYDEWYAKRNGLKTN